MFSLFNLRENYKFYIWVTIGAAVIGIAFFWLQNILAGEEARVRKFILQGKHAVESKDILTCTNMISQSYHDRYGNDRSSLIYAAKEFFAYYSKVFINIERMDIKLDDRKTQADLEIVALMIGQTQQNSMEKILEGEKGKAGIKLIKEENKWKLAEVEFYEQITIMGQNII
jgi:heme exporter protein D